MRWFGFGYGRLAAVAALAIAAAGALAIAQSATAGTGTSGSVCVGRHPNTAVWYTGACSGHDEPELDPVSSLAGSARDLTWTVILPKDGKVPVSAVGPTFW